jgi:hypothetical protein
VEEEGVEVEVEVEEVHRTIFFEHELSYGRY